MRLSLELGMEEKVLPLPTWNTLTPVPAQSDIGAERNALGKVNNSRFLGCILSQSESS